MTSERGIKISRQAPGLLLFSGKSTEAVRFGASGERPTAMTKQRIKAQEKVPLHLTSSQRTLIIDEAMVGADMLHALEQAQADGTRLTVMMTVDALDELAGFVADAAEAQADPQMQRKLSRLSDHIGDTANQYSEDA